MKRLLLCCLVLAACKKYAASPDPAYCGKWTWVRSVTGPTETFATPGDTTVLNLETDGSYQVLYNGQVVLRGSFGLSSFGLSATSLGGDLLKLSNTSGQLLLPPESIVILRPETQIITTLGEPNDTLTMTEYPTSPDATTNVFGR
ncbi:hypothetical protein [Dinghuibacter silviterrae]|uniref:Lipocalin-like protein n=1 Tax=Dinghuibacter silviterrae TaxID=1539049 RepID=A0A4R8DUH6_9BACT|nr:hypothetical protein [Dinghuibacter silviterrae]TDX02030.1 hypothetical protein EDB95_3078 [Dinghuibacter silviterrae]